MGAMFGVLQNPCLVSLSLTGMTLTLVLAVILSGMIGLERELHGHQAGLRTHIMVCLGSTLITLVSVQYAMATGGKADPGRISAQIVSGVGFLGAGAIIRDGATIRGLTTAASIWTTAAIGIALGSGPFYAVLACVTTLIVVFTLYALQVLERWLEGKGKLNAVVQLRMSDNGQPVAAALAVVVASRLTIHSVQHFTNVEPGVDNFLLLVRLPAGFNRTELITKLSQVKSVVQVTIE